MPTFTVNANTGGLDTQIDLKLGDQVRIEASGLLAIAGSHGPGGVHEIAAPNWPVPGLRKYGLFAQYGRNYVVPIPQARHEDRARVEFTALLPGRLRLCLNDDNPAARSGAFQVDVHIGLNVVPAVPAFPFFLAANEGRAMTDAGGDQVYRSLELGDDVVLEAFGLMNNGSSFAADNGPSGYNNHASPADLPAPGLPPCCVYVETGYGSTVVRQIPFQGQDKAPYGTIRFTVMDNEKWLRVRLNDKPLADNRGAFRIFLWKNARGQHLAQYGVHVAQPLPLNGYSLLPKDHAETGRAYPHGLSSISPYAIKQHSIGNCYLLAALASQARSHPHLIRDMITDHQDGTYTVRVYDGLRGRQVSLLLDSTLPAWLGVTLQKDGSLEVLWPALLQKAYCLMKGFDYNAMASGGISYDPWDILTGTPSEWNLFAPAAIRDWLETRLRAGRPLVASTFELGDWIGGGQGTVWGIHRQHVYSVLDYEPRGGQSGDWRVYLFDPHHETQYVSDRPEDLTEGRHGFFWMPLSKFNDVFGQVVCVELSGQTPCATMYQVDAAGQLKTAWSEGWRYPWDVVVAVQFGNQRGFLSHRFQDHEACLDSLDVGTGKLTQVWRRSWAHRWNLIVPVRFGQETGILSFCHDDGLVHLDRFKADGTLAQVWHSDNEPVWDVVVPFSAGGESGIVKQRFADRSFELHRFQTNGQLRRELSWSSGVAEVMVPVTVGGKGGIFSHRFAQRVALLDLIQRTQDASVTPPRDVLSLENQWVTHWARDWDMILPVAWGSGGRGLLSYDSDTGQVCLDRFGGDGRLTEQWRQALHPRPNLLASVPLGDKTWVLGHTW